MEKFLETCIVLIDEGEFLFIKYDNIYSIGKPVKKKEGWIVEMTYYVKCDNVSGYEFIYDTLKEAQTRQQYLFNKCIEYHTRNSSLNEKLDKLLAHIEILPGGEEYEKAKERFEK